MERHGVTVLEKPIDRDALLHLIAGHLRDRER
jgi:hypothetical protein